VSNEQLKGGWQVNLFFHSFFQEMTELDPFNSMEVSEFPKKSHIAESLCSTFHPSIPNQSIYETMESRPNHTFLLGLIMGVAQLLNRATK